MVMCNVWRVILYNKYRLYSIYTHTFQITLLHIQATFKTFVSVVSTIQSIFVFTFVFIWLCSAKMNEKNKCKNSEDLKDGQPDSRLHKCDF